MYDADGLPLPAISLNTSSWDFLQKEQRTVSAGFSRFLTLGTPISISRGMETPAGRRVRDRPFSSHRHVMPRASNQHIAWNMDRTGAHAKWSQFACAPVLSMFHA